MKKLLPVLLLVFASASISRAQLVINEVSSAADTGYADEDSDYEDWIELYNNSSSSIDLENYSISKTEDFKTRTWTFPKISIPAYGYLTIFCSEKNRKDYFHHWEVPVYAAGIWKYDIGTSNPPSNWTLPTFNDAAWLSGTGGIGYGDADDGTVIPQTTALYMRQSFYIADTGKIVLGAVLADIDDGFVAFLNGVEIARMNVGIAGDHPTNTTFAYDEHEAQMYQNGNFSAGFFVSKDLMDSALVNGLNTFAIQVHNYQNGMDDMTAIPYFLIGINDTTVTFYPFPAQVNLHTDFNLNSTGQQLILRDANGTLLDQQTIGAMQMNNSRGRMPDGSAIWCLFDNPTANKTNNNSNCFSDYTGVPAFSLPAGYYNSAKSLTLTGPANTQIRYSLDGSVPTIWSPVYSSPIQIDSTTVVRARCFSTTTGLLPGYDITNTYFINDSTTIPVISMSTESYNLFDYWYGIYEFGPNADTANIPFHGSNFWNGWVRPAHIEYFDQNKYFQFETNAEIKIQGNYSKSWPQKGFTVKAKDNYGGLDVNYRLFPDKPDLKDFKNFNIRNAGSDWNTCHMRDRLNHKTVQKSTSLDIMDGRPCLLYINGKYFGLYELRERQDVNYLANNHNADPEKVDFLEFDGNIIAGSNKGFLDMVSYIASNPMSTQSNYDSAAKMIDIKNFADYFITETYVINIDWLGTYTNNIKYWRPNNPPGKWRYVLWDTDLSLGFIGFYDGGDTTNMLHRAIAPPVMNPHSVMLSALLQNTEFKNYFVNRYADLMNTIFRPDKFRNKCVELRDEMYPEMQRHFQKWGGTMPIWNFIGRSVDVPSWMGNIDTMMYFMDNRIIHARDHIQSEFSLTKQVDVGLATDPADAGTITINTITADSLPWSGVYFDGVPVTITANDKPGYTFQYWKKNSLLAADGYNRTITYNVDTNETFVAVYRKLDYNFTFNPNPFTNSFTVTFEVPERQQVGLYLYDVLGRQVAELISAGTFQEEGTHTVTFTPADFGLSGGIYFAEIKGKEFQQTLKVMKVNE